jgi:gliding motility-associated-like protein
LDDTFDLTGNINVFAPPSSGFLTITESCGGNSIVLTPPFNTNIAYTFPGLISNGSPCSVTASFSADATCTATANYNAPPSCFVPECTFLSHTANVSGCDPASITYDVNGIIEFDFAPATGSLTVEMCSGETQTFNAPFVSPIAYSFTGLEPNNDLCAITASFSDEPLCSYTFDIQEPFPCSCPAEIGTFTTPIGEDSFFCFGETLTISSNGDFAAPVDVADAAIPYDPAIGYFIFTCEPTMLDIDLQNDPCYAGLWTTGSSATALNDGSFFDQFPGASFQDGTFYILPVTLYNQAQGQISVTNWVGDCFDIGTPMMFTFLDELTAVDSEECLAGNVIITPSGGGPAFDFGEYSISNITPSGIVSDNTQVSEGEDFILSGLIDGMNYSYEISDDYGCTAIGGGGPFVGPIVPVLAPVNDVCSEDAPFQLQATPTAGTWTGPGVSAAGLFNPSSAGVGTHTLTFTPSGCSLSETVDVTVIFQPDATITPLNTICINISAFELSAPTDGGVWSGQGVVSSSSGLFSPASAGIGTHQVSYVIDGFCNDQDQINIEVVGLPEVSFSASENQGCSPLNVTLEYTGQSDLNACTWFLNNQINSSNCGPLNLTLSEAGCYDVRYAVVDDNGCQNSLELDNLICVIESPVALFQSNTSATDVLNPEISFFNLSANAISYLWNFANQGFSTDVHSEYTFDVNQGTTVRVCLTATNELECTNTFCEELIIPEVFFIYVPNTFTPNNDGINDVFQPKINPVIEGEVFEYELQVLNRWGDVVFYSTDPDEVWVGDADGGDYFVPDGLYFWRAKVRPIITDATKEYEGHLYIMR